MAVKQVQEWFESHSIEIEDGVSLERLDALLSHLSTNQQIDYPELYLWLSSLRIPANQNPVIESYEKLFGFSPAPSNGYLEPRWSMANLVLNLEHDIAYHPITGATEVMTEAEKYVIRVLGNINQEIMPLVVYHDTLYIPQVANISWYVRLFYDLAATNTYLGAAKSATVFFRLLERLGSITGCSQLDYACLLSDWAFALQRLENYQAAGEMYKKSMEYFDSTVPTFANPEEVSGRAKAALRAGSMMLVAEFYEEAGQRFDDSERLLMSSSLAQHPELLFCRGQVNLFRGGLHMQTGHVASALQSFQAAEESLEECLKSARAICAADYILLLRIYSEASANAGNWLKANSLSHKAEQIVNAPDMAYRFDLQLELARVNALLGLHAVRKRSSPTLDGAIQNFARADDRYLKLNYQERSDLHLEVGLLHANWATALTLEKRFEASLRYYASALKYITSAADSQAPPVALQLGHIYANQSVMLRRTGNLKAAVESCRRAEKYYEIVAVHDPSMAMEGVAKLHCILARVYLDSELEDEARAEVLKSLALFERPELSHRRDLDLDRFRAYVVGASLADQHLQTEWAVQASRMMSVYLELREPFAAESDLMLYLFYTFHYKWIEHLFRASPADVPLALCALHGRRLSRKLLDEAEQYQDSTDDPKVKELLGLRRQLMQGQQLIGETFADFKELIKDALQREVERSVGIGTAADDGTPPFSKVEAQQEQLENIIGQSHGDAAHYVDLRNQLLGKVSGSTILDPFATVDAAALADRLKPHEALVCLLDLRLEAIDEIVEIKDQYAWILLSSGKVKVKKLELELDGSIDFARFRDEHNRRRAVRRGVERPKRDGWPELSSGESLARHCSSHLWEPVASELPEQVTHLSIVTQGRFHIFPLESGKPERLSLSHYINLIFFAREHPISTRSSELPYQILLNRTPDLPFANREADPLLTTIWKTASESAAVQLAESLDNIDAGASVQCLHVAGHGHREPDRNRQHLVAQLTFNAHGSLTEQMILTKMPRTKVVWLSSCVIGLTEDDREGDPVGMIVPFLMKGARFVFASLAEVPDLWMPLLVALTEWFRTVEREPLPGAFNHAKSILNNWIHEPELAGFYRIYSDWLRETWRLWLLGNLDSGEEEPWTSLAEVASRAFFDEQWLQEIAPHLRQLESAGGLADNARLELLLDKLVEGSLIPPNNECERLTYAVKLFTG